MTDSKNSAEKRKHAIILVHGQGQQRPQKMVGEFIEHVFGFNFKSEKQAEGAPQSVRLIPETISDLDDTRRLEVHFEGNAKPDFDLFEFYWASKMSGNALIHFYTWFFALLRRPALRFPPDLRIYRFASLCLLWLLCLWALFYAVYTSMAFVPLEDGKIRASVFNINVPNALNRYYFVPIVLIGLGAFSSFLMAIRRFGWAANFAVITLALCSLVQTVMILVRDEVGDETIASHVENHLFPSINLSGAHGVVSLLFLLVLLFSAYMWVAKIRPFLIDVMADSARYLNNRPENIDARHEIRHEGMNLFSALTKSDRYDEIIVVAHSLGSIAAYDVIRQFFGQKSNDMGNLPPTIMKEIQEALKTYPANCDEMKIAQWQSQTWQPIQARLFEKHKNKWPISRFITMGSPLSHARLLLEGDPETPHVSETFECQRDVTYSIATSPPRVLFGSNEPKIAPSMPFLFTKWTNLYFSDDIVGGSVSEDLGEKEKTEVLGYGIDNHRLSPKDGIVKGLSHNSYWMDNREGQSPWIRLLREKLGIA